MADIETVPPIPACVINMADQAHRWSMMERECQDAGLHAVRLDAVIGRLLPQTEIERIYSDRLNQSAYHQRLTAGEIGCYASHIQAWRNLLATQHDCCIVLEDDVHLSADFSSVTRHLAARREPWDMIKLIGRPHEQIRTAHTLVDGLELIRYQRVPSYTSAYMISRRGAEKLLSSRLPFGRPIDIDLRHWWENDLEIFGVQPYPVSLSPASAISSMQHHLGTRNAWSKVKKMRQQFAYSIYNWLSNLSHDQ